MALLLDPDRALMRGVPTKVIEAATGNGTSFSHAFSVIRNPMADGADIVFQAIGTFTIFNGIIEASSNGGTNWVTAFNFDFVASPLTEFEFFAGLVYRFNISNITETAPPDVLATLG